MAGEARSFGSLEKGRMGERGLKRKRFPRSTARGERALARREVEGENGSRVPKRERRESSWRGGLALRQGRFFIEPNEARDGFALADEQKGVAGGDAVVAAHGLELAVRLDDAAVVAGPSAQDVYAVTIAGVEVARQN